MAGRPRKKINWQVGDKTPTENLRIGKSLYPIKDGDRVVGFLSRGTDAKTLGRAVGEYGQ